MLREVFTHDGCIIYQMWVLAMAHLFIKPLRSHLYQWLMFAHRAICSVSENDYLFDMTTFLLYFPIYHKLCCSSLYNRTRVLFNLLSPWPLWYMGVVLFCISSWPPISSLSLIQNLRVAGVFSWVSDYPLLYLQYKLQTPSYNTWILLNLASADLSSCMYCWGPQHRTEVLF